jgi:hypothetical protein
LQWIEEKLYEDLLSPWYEPIASESLYNRKLNEEQDGPLSLNDCLIQYEVDGEIYRYRVGEATATRGQLVLASKIDGLIARILAYVGYSVLERTSERVDTYDVSLLVLLPLDEYSDRRALAVLKDIHEFQFNGATINVNISPTVSVEGKGIYAASGLDSGMALMFGHADVTALSFYPGSAKVDWDSSITLQGQGFHDLYMRLVRHRTLHDELSASEKIALNKLEMLDPDPEFKEILRDEINQYWLSLMRSLKPILINHGVALPCGGVYQLLRKPIKNYFAGLPEEERRQFKGLKFEDGIVSGLIDGFCSATQVSDRKYAYRFLDLFYSFIAMPSVKTDLEKHGILRSGEAGRENKTVWEEVKPNA